MTSLLKINSIAQRRIVALPGGDTFDVRGLNPLNVVALYRRHAGELEPLFTRVASAAQGKGPDVAATLVGFLSETPTLMAEIIAVASGADPDGATDETIIDPATGEPIALPAFDAAVLIARSLPFTVQIDALSKVGELTFTQDMPPGKFVALVLTLLRSVTGAVQGLTANLPPLSNGSGAFADPSTS